MTEMQTDCFAEKLAMTELQIDCFTEKLAMTEMQTDCFAEKLAMTLRSLSRSSFYLHPQKHLFFDRFQAF